MDPRVTISDPVSMLGLTSMSDKPVDDEIKFSVVFLFTTTSKTIRVGR